MLGVSRCSSARISPSNVMRIVRSSSSKATTSATAEAESYPNGWNQAKRFEEIPGPTKWQLFRNFLPGGAYRGLSIIEMQARIFQDYGPISIFPGMLGKPDMIFTYDPALFETVYRTEGIWPRRRGMAAFTYYREKVRPDVFKGMGGLVSDQGETWQKLRSAVNPVMMSPKVTKSYVPDVDTVARDFVKKVHVLRDANDEMPASFGNEMNLWALESIGMIALERRLGVMAFERDASADRIIQVVKDFFRLSYHIEIQPAIWRYYQTKEFKQLMACFEAMTELVMGHVNESVEALEKAAASGETLTNRITEMSVLQKLLQTNRDYAILMTFDMLFAGIDTTSSTSANLLYHLAKNPAEQEKLREEVFKVLPDRNVSLQRNDLDHMPYMKACIKESMRLAPIISGHLRGTGQNLVLAGYQVPKDTDLIMATSMLMTDETHFSNPNAFKPERWLRDPENAGAQETKSINPFVFLPFGFGTRSCVGRRFAEMEIQILTTRLLRDYRIEWHHGPMEYAIGIIRAPSSELKYKLIPL